MISIIADTHCHTSASTHAYSSLQEDVQAAANIGLKALAITDHGPKNQDAPHPWYFHNLPRVVPKQLYGVTLLRGIEANIMDYDGTLDLEEEYLKKLDWVIASYHRCNCPPTNLPEQVTQSYLKLAQNPLVDVIGHSGSPYYPYDYERCIKAFKEYGKLVEINQNSFLVRKASLANCREIARLCKKYEVSVVVNSDAHISFAIGQVSDAIQMLTELDFPEKLVLNADWDRFQDYLKQKADRIKD
jgi:putative hydrolase